jgi:ATP-dependent Zn protease
MRFHLVSPRMNRLSPAGIAAIAVLVVVVLLGGLYAYRAQTPAMPTVPMAVAIQAVQEGHVRQILYEDNRATLTLDDGRREQTVTPPGGQDPLVGAALQFNQQNPSRMIEVRFERRGPELAPPLFGFITAFLPLVLLLLLVVLGARIIAAGRAPDAYERLERIANLRDRGVLTDEEFQREKRRLLK